MNRAVARVLLVIAVVGFIGPPHARAAESLFLFDPEHGPATITRPTPNGPTFYFRPEDRLQGVVPPAVCATCPGFFLLQRPGESPSLGSWWSPPMTPPMPPGLPGVAPFLF